ncbi:hypothetical protein M422DRAFT_160583, partial [Sphaerobolus stellatus SS14]
MPPVRGTAKERKVRTVSKPYNHTNKAGRPLKKDLPKSSAIKLAVRGRKNLTLHDWLTVFKWIDEHPLSTQKDIVDHFASLKDGALIFTQSTLSRKLQIRQELENERKNANPNALSSKRPRIVTQPEVDRSLYLWVLQMEGKGETVNGAMLEAKRAVFEEKFNIPMERRLNSNGWLRSFCQAYKIKEYRRHGEAASVDVAAVEVERKRLQTLLLRYPREDIYNFDESGFFPFAPPDRGLATQQMKGKKADKFRITIGVACNANGHKLPLCFIGKSKKPRSFNSKCPTTFGYQYWSNTKAWMTRDIFTDYIKQLDILMRSLGRFIILLLDNFSGHYITYEPRNIRLEFFQPNMTPFVQPCDAGIIRCLKAHYRKAYCLRALKLEEAEQRDIYKISIREAMALIKEAWDNVTADTVQHCWDHTLILP